MPRRAARRAVSGLGAAAVAAIAGSVAGATVGPRRTARAEIEIDASPGRVWWVLTDFASYGAWNALVPSALGDPRPGEVLTLRVRPGPRRAVRVHPVVRVARPGSRLRVTFRFLLPALLTGEHTIDITPQGRTVRMSQETVVSGFLVPLLPFAAGDLESALRAMNEALRGRAEAQAANPPKPILGKLPRPDG